MPPQVKKGISVTILTTLSTSIILALLGWFGNSAVIARDNKNNVEHEKEYRHLLMSKIDALLIITSNNKLAINENHVRVIRNEKDIKELSHEFTK